MVGDLGDHRHVRTGAREDGLVDPVHILGDEGDEPLQAGFGGFFVERYDQTQGASLFVQRARP